MFQNFNFSLKLLNCIITNLLLPFELYQLLSVSGSLHGEIRALEALLLTLLLRKFFFRLFRITYEMNTAKPKLLDLIAYLLK